MSTRSIFEINHDFSHKIEDDPEGFVKVLRYYLSSGDQRHADELQRRYGMRRVWWGHHSTERKIVTKHGETKL
jgi:hypothetical protein